MGMDACVRRNHVVAESGASPSRMFFRFDADSDEAGRAFRFQAGHRSDAKPAGIPI
jgi:hypothetical protein